MADFRRGKITPELFKVVKTLLDSGNTVTETAKFIKLGMGTVSNIKNSESYEEYKNIAYEQVKAYKAKAQENKNDAPPAAPAPVVKEVHQTVTIQATHYMMQELQKTNKLLEQISAKLAYIVEDLYGTGKKEG